MQRKATAVHKVRLFGAGLFPPLLVFMRHLRSILFLLSLVGLLSAAPSLSLAEDGTVVRSVVGRVGRTSGFANICGATACVATLIGKVINILLGLLGVALIGYILYAGYLWMTSGGESERAEEAQKVVRNAVIGVFVVGFAYTLSGMVLNFVSTTFTPIAVQAPDTSTAATPAPGTAPRTSANIRNDPFAVGCVENECADSCISQECSELTGQRAFTCESTCQTRCTAACRPRVNAGLLDCEQPRYDTCLNGCVSQTDTTARNTCRSACASSYCSSNGSTGSGMITDTVSCRDAAALRTCYTSCVTQSESVGSDITEDDVHNDPFDIGGPRVTVESLRAERREAFINTCNSQCLATNCR